MLPQELELDGNALSSTLPTELGLLKHLTSINLRENELTGTMPSGETVDSLNIARKEPCSLIFELIL